MASQGLRLSLVSIIFKLLLVNGLVLEVVLLLPDDLVNLLRILSYLVLPLLGDGELSSRWGLAHVPFERTPSLLLDGVEFRNFDHILF